MPNGNDCNIFIRLDFVRPKFYIESIMHGRIKNGLCVLILSAVLSIEAVVAAQSGGARYTLDDYRNYYGSWAGTSPRESLIFAKNMGYRYVLYIPGMENFKESDGLLFVLETPEYMTYSRTIDTKKKYSKKQIEEWESICAMKDASKPFPENMASGWFWDWWTADITGDNNQQYSSFSLQLNFQKKSVIDRTVRRIFERAKNIMAKNPKFRLGGCSWDVPDPTGDFYGKSPQWKRPRQVSLEFWTGSDSVSVPKGEKLDYPTYSEGTMRYRCALRNELRKLNPDVKFIMDPWLVYRDCVKRILDGGFNKPEFAGAMPDLAMSESPSEDFASDSRNFEGGILDASTIATSSDLSAYDFAREIRNIGLAASVGSWSAWFGNPCPTAKSIRDIPPRLKITRALATWENLNNTPLSERKWDADENKYSSPTAHMDKDCVWAVHPETKRLFFCMTTPDGEVEIPEGFEVEKIYVLDSVFGEYRWPKLDKIFDLSDGKISLKKGSEYVCGEGFSAILKKSEK